jgi:hypothetical protein
MYLLAFKQVGGACATIAGLMNLPIPVQSLVDFIGIFSIGLGLLLILSGLDIVHISSVSVTAGRKTWITGIIFAIIGAFFLFPALSKALKASSSLTPDNAATSAANSSAPKKATAEKSPTAATAEKKPTTTVTTEKKPAPAPTATPRPLIQIVVPQEVGADKSAIDQQDDSQNSKTDEKKHGKDKEKKHKK